MISVRNRLQPLNGSKFSWLFIGLFLSMVACSATRKASDDRAVLKNQMEEKSDSTLAADKLKQEKEIEELAGPQIPEFENDFDVALFLPFNLHQEPKPGTYENFLRESVLDYYQGLLLGLDVLKAEGINLRLHVHDTKGDSATVAKLMARLDLQDMDLIMGPVMPKPFALLSNYGKEHEIPVVSPFSMPERDFANPNPYAFYFSPQLDAYGKAVAKYIKSKAVPVSVYYLSDGSETDKSFKAGLDLELKESGIKYTLRKIGPRMNILPLMKQDSVVNIIMVPSDKEVQVEQAIESFRQKYYRDEEKPDTREFVVELIGLDSWRDFRDPEFKYWERYNLSLFVNSFADRSDSTYLDFKGRYKSRFTISPGVLSVKGYDQIIFLGNSLLAFGPYFPKYVLDTRFQGISMDYHWNFNGAVVENTALRHIRFYDYRFILRD